MHTDKVTTLNYIVHIGCEGRYLGITGRVKKSRRAANISFENVA
jgi:hypothetical protein